MRLISDSAQSLAITLSRAHKAARANQPFQLDVSKIPDDVQAGALLSLADFCKTHFQNTAAEKTLAARLNVDANLANTAQLQVCDRVHFTTDDLEKTLGRWLDSFFESARSRFLVGFWLSRVFIRGLRAHEAEALTGLLKTKRVELTQLTSTRTVRRYPTGGISEKQALILPAIIRSFATKFELTSLFLIAGLLAHTGGTRAKLSAIDGFRCPEPDSLLDWNFRSNPVAYVSASKNLCPRDMILYNARSRTGTVEDFGLMASSIMCKQLSIPADLIILDVLFGPHSFIDTEDRAVKFGNLCRDIGNRGGLDLAPMTRHQPRPFGAAIGTSTEVTEAIELLHPNGSLGGLEESVELQASLRFLKRLSQSGSKLQSSDKTVEFDFIERLKVGDFYRSFESLLEAHGVKASYVSRLRENPRRTLSDGLEKHQVTASSTGKLQWNYTALADFINTKINRPKRSKKSFEVERGGVWLTADSGCQVTEGTPLIQVWTSAAIDDSWAVDLETCFNIS